MLKAHIRLTIMLALLLAGQMSHAKSDSILQRFLPQAQAGNAQAQYTVGARYYQLHDFSNARIWMQKSAAQGNQPATGFLQNFLGGAGAAAAPPAGYPMHSNTAMDTGAELCPGTGRALEKGGLFSVLQQAAKQMPTGAKPMLSMVMLTTQGICQYTFVLDNSQAMTFADVPGGLRSMGARPAVGATKVVLPAAFTDLPSAIVAAQQQGMQLPLKSAMLVMEQPRGKPPIAVWTLQPKVARGGRVESYFIAAADAGRPLTLNDISDLARNYNAQWRHIIDQFHAAEQAKQNAGKSSAGSCVNMTLFASVDLVPLYHGHWTYGGATDANGRPLNQMTFDYRGQQLSPYWKCTKDGS